MAKLSPAPQFEMDFSVCFSDPAIGQQSKQLALTGSSIVSELCDSRTFGYLADVETIHGMGLGRGGCLGNAIIVDNGRILNADGLRHPDEFVRHKMLDAVGDLALAGAPIIGRYTGVKAGHEISNLLLRELFACREAWEWCDLRPGQAPGGALNLPVPQFLDTSVAV
jgi:UDP-3-O-[3-hydroxymyristoyl] N-acetylglucosamine deacetylase